MNLKDIVALRLAKYAGKSRGNPQFDKDEIDRLNLEAAQVCLDAKCAALRCDQIGFGTDMVHCPAHRFKFMVKGSTSGEYKPEPVTAADMPKDGMVELFR